MPSRLFTEDEMLSAITACIRAERLRAGEFERELERVRPQLEEQARSFDRIRELCPPWTTPTPPSKSKDSGTGKKRGEQ